jgi:cellulase (glycosyl hydrolase family 5)
MFLTISSTAPTSCSANCPPQQPPAMIGFGGLRLDSATANSTACAVCYKNSTFVASNVFPGQSQSDTERLVVKMKAMGMNTIRVSFAPYCSNPAGDGHSDSPYTLTDAKNTIAVANYYGFWIVLRYDGDSDITTQTTCWINYWQMVIQQVGPLYSQIVWEPINEPSANVSTLSTDYELWINMARSVGDAHFIAVENQCSRSCPYSGSNIWQGYPTVTDSLGKVLISFHKYYAYNCCDVWTVSAAIATANSDYQGTILGEQNTGWYALDTEGGPSMGDSTCNGSSGTTSGCPPGTYLPGSAGYSNVSFAYIQTITRLFDSHVPRINWVWWPIGAWVDTECSGSYGALQPAYCPGGTNYTGGVGWANLLQYVSLNTTSTPPPPGNGGTCLQCWLEPIPPWLFIFTIGIASGFLLVAGFYFASNRSRDRSRVPTSAPSKR